MDRQRIPATAAVEGSFVRLTILNNHGDPDWTELMSFRGFGEKPALQPLPAISGTYRTNYNDFHLRHQGGALIGCYDFYEGIFEGTIEGRVVKLTWMHPAITAAARLCLYSHAMARAFGDIGGATPIMGVRWMEIGPATGLRTRPAPARIGPARFQANCAASFRQRVGRGCTVFFSMLIQPAFALSLCRHLMR
jgi:hypothetical protein